MTSSHHNHLARIDLALVHLLQERARISQFATETEQSTKLRIEDLLRRTKGPFCNSTLSEILRLAATGSHTKP